MLDAKTYSVPNWLDVEGRRLLVIVSVRKPACWHCSVIGHLSAVCSGKKALKKPDQNPGTLPPVVTNTEKEAPVVSPTSTGKKNLTPSSSSTVSSEESGAEWLTVGKGGSEVGSSLPKVVPGGHQQFTHLKVSTKYCQFLSILCKINKISQDKIPA